jgi:hypothetical protein
VKLKNVATHTIAGRAYRLSKLPIIQSGRIAAKIGKSILPAIASAQGIDLKDTVSLTKAISVAIQDIDAELFFDDAMLCVKNGCNVNEYDIAEHHYFEKHFANHPQDLFPVLIWALKENIGGFFDLGALFQGNQDKEVTQ